MLTKEECEKALTRLYRPLFVSTRIQNAFYRVNGNEYSINDDSNLLEQLIKEHFELVEAYDELKEAFYGVASSLNNTLDNILDNISDTEVIEE